MVKLVTSQTGSKCVRGWYFCFEQIKGIADFFLVDTTPFIVHYWNNTKFDWRGVAPRDTYIANLLKVYIKHG